MLYWNYIKRNCDDSIYWALPSRWARLHKTVLKSVRGLLTFVLEQQPFVLK